LHQKQNSEGVESAPYFPRRLVTDNHKQIPFLLEDCTDVNNLAYSAHFFLYF